MELTLTPTQTICGRHGEAFKPNWPTGYPLFAQLCMQALLAQKGFQEELERFGATEGLTSIMDAFSAITHKRPMCCRLTPTTLLAVYREVNQRAGVWADGTCSLCGKHAPGCEYRKAPPNARSMAPAATWPHVCLACIAWPWLRTNQAAKPRK